MKQPEALRLADALQWPFNNQATQQEAAAELRRLHEANQAMVDIHEAVLDEREACANVCEQEWNKYCEEPYGYALAVKECAAAIRARSNT